VDQANKEYPEIRARAGLKKWKPEPFKGNRVLKEQIAES